MREEKLIEHELIKGKIILNKDEINHHFIYLFFKRMMDIIGSFIGILFSLPISFWVSYKILQEEPDSPIFFSQTRVGKNGKTFKMYKFRSMCVDAEEKLEALLNQNEVDGAMFKMKEDPRITKIGKFIRAKSIDELPQLWNVLKGDMSLVGPRPPLEREVKEYDQYDEQRLFVKPGCSGLWQVSGRNALSFKEMVELDIEYARHHSIIFDVIIIIKTIGIMVHPNGAY